MSKEKNGLWAFENRVFLELFKSAFHPVFFRIFLDPPETSKWGATDQIGPKFEKNRKKTPFFLRPGLAGPKKGPFRPIFRNLGPQKTEKNPRGGPRGGQIFEIFRNFRVWTGSGTRPGPDPPDPSQTGPRLVPGSSTGPYLDPTWTRPGPDLDQILDSDRHHPIVYRAYSYYIEFIQLLYSIQQQNYFLYILTCCFN